MVVPMGASLMLMMTLGIVGVSARPAGAATSLAGSHGGVAVVPGISKIKHIVMIQQENRSFDSYLGTYPGADGTPMSNGVPTVCSPDPVTATCQQPFVDHADVNGGGPHGASAAVADVSSGAMNGYVSQVRGATTVGCIAGFTDLACAPFLLHPDVMGNYAGSDIPNYWAYA
jgi:phospholipase C